jgi:hypothetical protein
MITYPPAATHRRPAPQSLPFVPVFLLALTTSFLGSR